MCIRLLVATMPIRGVWRPKVCAAATGCSKLEEGRFESLWRRSWSFPATSCGAGSPVVLRSGVGLSSRFCLRMLVMRENSFSFECGEKSLFAVP